VNVLHQPIGQRRPENPFPDLRAGRGQRVDIIDVKLGEQLVYALVEAVSTQETAIGSCRRCKPARHADPEVVEITDHLTKGGILPADHLHIIHSKLRELDDVRLQTMLPCVPEQEMDNRLQISDIAATVNAAP
jgi:hypothetical protein